MSDEGDDDVTTSEMRPETDATGAHDTPASPASNGSAPQVLDKGALLAASAFAVTDVPLPSGAGIVRIRPLSRAEALQVYDREMDAAEMEQWVLSKALVEPRLTPGEVAKWQENSAAGSDIQSVVQTVLHASGMDIGAGKAAYKRFRGAT